MTDRASVSRWLARYVAAWKSYDRDSIGELFSADAECRYHPYDEPLKSREAIVESWLEDPDEAGTYDGRYEPIAVDADVAVAVGESIYWRPDSSLDRVYDNIFVLRFDEDGRCREFTEWFMKRP